MSAPRRSLIVRSLAWIGLSTWLAGCTQWSPMDPSRSYADAVTEEQPEVIQIETADGEELKLYQAMIVGDSIVGTTDWRAESVEQNDARVAVALDDVAGIDQRRPFTAGTVMLVIVVAGVAFIGLASAAAAQGFGQWGS